MGYFEAESAFYPCEIVEVCESTYIVHFFDTPEQDLYELDETQLMEERVMEEGTPIFTFLDEDPDNERWAKGTVSQPTDTGYVVHLDGTPDEELIELAEDNVYPIEVQVGDQGMESWSQKCTVWFGLGLVWSGLVAALLCLSSHAPFLSLPPHLLRATRILLV